MGGDATRGSPVPLQASIIPPLRSYHKPSYVKNLSFCVRASATTYYNLVIVEPAPSEIPLPRAARLFCCLFRRFWAVLTVEMGRSVYCVWPIPCEYGVRLVRGPTRKLGGGVGLCIFVLIRVRAKLALGPTPNT